MSNDLRALKYVATYIALIMRKMKSTPVVDSKFIAEDKENPLGQDAFCREPIYRPETQGLTRSRVINTV